MPNYLPSLSERKRRIFENVCATCGGEGDASGDTASAMDDSESESDDTTLLKTLKMLDKKRDKKKKK